MIEGTLNAFTQPHLPPVHLIIAHFLLTGRTAGLVQALAYKYLASVPEEVKYHTERVNV